MKCNFRLIQIFLPLTDYIPAEDYPLIKLLSVAAISDILSEMGHRHQVMHQRLRPLLPDIRNCGFIGRARTFEWKEINYVDEKNPYGLEIEAMDALTAGDVVIHSTDFNGTNAPWGELMSTIAKRKGVAGCVCDSQVRDCVKIIDMNFPVYYAGICPLDSKGRGIVVAYDVPVQCGEVLVNHGELVYADFDGIVTVPKSDEKELLERVRKIIHADPVMQEGLHKRQEVR